MVGDRPLMTAAPIAVRVFLCGLLVVLLTAALGSSTLLAQPGPPPGGGPGTGADEVAAEMRERLRERIRVMRAWRLTEALALDEATALRLFDHLDAFDARIYAEQDALAALGRRLQEQLSAPSPDGPEIRALVEQITSTHLRIEQLRVELVRESGALLEPRQQAALMLFLPDFDQQIQQLVRDVRRPPQGRRRGTRRGELLDQEGVDPGDVD
jgi:hypothetical protein